MGRCLLKFQDKKTIVNNWVNTGETIIVTGGSQFNAQSFTNGAAGTMSARKFICLLCDEMRAISFVCIHFLTFTFVLFCSFSQWGSCSAY